MQYLKFIKFLNDSQKNDIFTCRFYAVKAKLRIALHKKAGSPEQQNKLVKKFTPRGLKFAILKS